MKLSLRDRLLRYLLKQHGWVSSRQIQEVVMSQSSYLPRTAIRRLQEMTESGDLEVQIRSKMAWYRTKPQESRQTILEENQKLLRFFDSYEAVKA